MTKTGKKKETKQKKETNVYTFQLQTKSSMGVITYLFCPHCNKTIILGQPEVNEALEKWVKQIKKEWNKPLINK